MPTFHDRISLSGNTCLITGASAGIGFELCDLLAEAGADVVAIGRNAAGLEDAVGRVGARGSACVTIVADLAEPSVARAASEALARRPVIDVPVNNADISFNRSLVDQTVDEWDRTMALNLRAPWLMAMALAPGMIEHGRGRS